MPRVLTISSQKGGSGKTTLSLNLYKTYTESNISCAIVEIDKQGSIEGLLNTFPDLNINLIKSTDFKKFSDLLELDYQLLIIDTMPSLDEKWIKEIYPLSDFILIPSKASVLDALSVMNTVVAAEMYGKKEQCGVVLNMVPTSLKYAEQVKALMHSNGIPLLKSFVKNRITYTRSVAEGSIFAENNRTAINEFKDLALEVFGKLNA